MRLHFVATPIDPLWTLTRNNQHFDAVGLNGSSIIRSWNAHTIDCNTLPAAAPADAYPFPPVEAEPSQKVGIFSKEWANQFSLGQPGCSGPLIDVYDWRDAGCGSNLNCESRMSR